MLSMRGAWPSEQCARSPKKIQIQLRLPSLRCAMAKSADEQCVTQVKPHTLLTLTHPTDFEPSQINGETFDWYAYIYIYIYIFHSDQNPDCYSKCSRYEPI